MIKRLLLLTVFLLAFAKMVSSAYQPSPLQIQSPDSQTQVTDRTSIEMLDNILLELKVLNEYMYKITGEEIITDDVE